MGEGLWDVLGSSPNGDKNLPIKKNKNKKYNGWFKGLAPFLVLETENRFNREKTAVSISGPLMLGLSYKIYCQETASL